MKSTTKTISLELKATQYKKGDTVFMGANVRNLPKGENVAQEPPFAMFSYNGHNLRIEEGMWLVEYPNGQFEVWTDDQINGKEAQDARLEPEEILKEADQKTVSDYQEHNPKIVPQPMQPLDVPKQKAKK